MRPHVLVVLVVIALGLPNASLADPRLAEDLAERAATARASRNYIVAADLYQQAFEEDGDAKYRFWAGFCLVRLFEQTSDQVYRDNALRRLHEYLALDPEGPYSKRADELLRSLQEPPLTGVRKGAQASTDGPEEPETDSRYSGSLFRIQLGLGAASPQDTNRLAAVYPTLLAGVELRANGHLCLGLVAETGDASSGPVKCSKGPCVSHSVVGLTLVSEGAAGPFAPAVGVRLGMVKDEFAFDEGTYPDDAISGFCSDYDDAIAARKCHRWLFEGAVLARLRLPLPESPIFFGVEVTLGLITVEGLIQAGWLASSVNLGLVLGGS